MTEGTSSVTNQPKRECRLCGYPSTDYRIIPVPLASPPQDNAVCADCLEELSSFEDQMNVDDHLAEKMRDPEFRREWEAHGDCFEEQKRLTRYIIRYRRLRNGYKAQRDEARDVAKEMNKLAYDDFDDARRLRELEALHPWLKED